MIVQSIKDKNENFKVLRLKLRQTSRQSLIELDNILSTVQDKKAFVFLMDAYETEKEITREILEQMLETSISINADIIEALEESDKNQIMDFMNSVFTGQNIKSLIIAAIVFGVLISIATHSDIASKIVDVVIPSPKESTK
jgi:hypothetical protein